MTSDWEVFKQRDLPKEVWKILKSKKFFGMIIPKGYGGLGFSAYGHSCVIEKLASCCQVLAITVMVPNSLGPAELLLHYGTEEQKKHYLPRLADGRDIPCFALTEPEAGSDADSIRSEGVLFKDASGEVKIRLNFEKRYITLSSIATVIGLAFVLKDPENILGSEKDMGITCALVTNLSFPVAAAIPIASHIMRFSDHLPQPIPCLLIPQSSFYRWKSMLILLYHFQQLKCIDPFILRLNSNVKNFYIVSKSIPILGQRVPLFGL